MRKSLSTEKSKILFFDGVCNLCNQFVDFLIRHDPRGKLKFASLQDEGAKKYVPEDLRNSLNTVVFYYNGHLFTESTAAIWAISSLGGPYLLLRVLLIIPESLRNAGYAYIAKNRYKWFGKRETCRLPTSEERKRFL